MRRCCAQRCTRSRATSIDADAVNKTVEDLTIALARTGEPFASVSPRKERHSAAGAEGAGTVDLVYTVGEGKRLYVERIDIHGNTKTSDNVIRREFDFGEGDAYNRALVDRGERHLKALGYFKSVKITTEPGSAPDRVVARCRGRGTADRQFLHFRRLFDHRRRARRSQRSAIPIFSVPATSPRLR